MHGKFSNLIERLLTGDMIHGTYIRRAVASGSGLDFDELIVKTDGGAEYHTYDQRESDTFFDLVDYQGYCCDAQSRADGCHYESMAYWRPSRRP